MPPVGSASGTYGASVLLERQQWSIGAVAGAPRRVTAGGTEADGAAEADVSFPRALARTDPMLLRSGHPRN